MSRFAIRGSYGAFGSDIVFGDVEAFIDRRAVAVALEYRVTQDLTLQVGGGVGHGGRLIVDGGAHHELLPGWLATVSGSYRLVSGGEAPFVLLTGTIGGSGARTRQYGTDETVGYNAFDLRIGVAAGKTFYDMLSPYLAARLFGGPILWELEGESVTGTDQHHYQIAFGLAASLPRGFDLFVEGAPFGERGTTVGAGVAF
jgi:hypothetical protein